MIRLSVLLLTCSVIPAVAQVHIGLRAIVNAGSDTPWGLPGGGIARGSVFSIFGTGLGPASSPPLAFPLSTALGNVSLKVSAANGGASVDAIPLYVSATQINALMPSNAPLGMDSMVVTYNNIRSNPAPVKIVNSTFGIFAVSGGGFGPGVLQNFNSQTDQPVNSLTVPAQPGQTIILWGTGLGPVTFPDNVAPTPGSLMTPVEVFVGGVSAPIAYSGRSPCCSGIDQIVFTVPANAPQGCWVPVQVRTEGAIPSNAVTMAIGPSGSACSETANPYANKFAAGGKLGWINLFREAERTTLYGLTVDTTKEYSSAVFRSEPGGQFAYNPLYSLPPIGTCTTTTGPGDLFFKGNIPGTFSAGKNLEAGPSLAVGPRRQPLTASTNAAFSPLGWFQTGITTFTSTLVLNPGSINLVGNAGKDVGSFQAGVPIPTPLTWTNRDQVNSPISRTQPLTVNYSGVPSGHTVLIVGGYFSPSVNATAMFICTASGTSTSFTVPSYILEQIPSPAVRDHRAAGGEIMVGSVSLANPLTFNTSGLDYGAVFLTLMSGKTVSYQ